MTVAPAEGGYSTLTDMDSSKRRRKGSEYERTEMLCRAAGNGQLVRRGVKEWLETTL